MEIRSYEEILSDVLALVPDHIDKREGSVIFTAIAPVCFELAESYVTLRENFDLAFADTSFGEYLDKICNQFGIFRKPATYAVRRATFTLAEGDQTQVPIGMRFGVGDIFFIVIEKDENHVYTLQCETVGSIGNKDYEDLLPVDYLESLKTAALGEVIIVGEDQEEDEELRKRCISRMKSITFGGNIADYQFKVKAISGVGCVRVTPCFSGGGTVKLTILDTEYTIANEQLIQKVQELIFPQSGDGRGLAPIGHDVLVDSCTLCNLTVSLQITLETGYSLENIQPQIEKTINDYILQLRTLWENENIVVRRSQIENKVLDVLGVKDVASTILNGVSGNFIPTDFMKLPALSHLEITVTNE